MFQVANHAPCWARQRSTASRHGSWNSVSLRAAYARMLVSTTNTSVPPRWIRRVVLPGPGLQLLDERVLGVPQLPQRVAVARVHGEPSPVPDRQRRQLLRLLLLLREQRPERRLDQLGHRPSFMRGPLLQLPHHALVDLERRLHMGTHMTAAGIRQRGTEGHRSGVRTGAPAGATTRTADSAPSASPSPRGSPPVTSTTSPRRSDSKRRFASATCFCWSESPSRPSGPQPM